MKTFEDLCNEVKGMTDIQVEEHIKKLSGTEITVCGKLHDISTALIFLQDPKLILHGTPVWLTHVDPQLREELLKYSPNQRVCLTALAGGKMSTYYNFRVVSIRSAD